MSEEKDSRWGAQGIARSGDMVAPASGKTPKDTKEQERK